MAPRADTTGPWRPGQFVLPVEQLSELAKENIKLYKLKFPDQPTYSGWIRQSQIIANAFLGALTK